MSGHSILHHSFLKAHQESPQLPAMYNISTMSPTSNMSPVSSLAYNMHYSLSHKTPIRHQNIFHATPKMKLRLSSNISDTSCDNVSQIVSCFDIEDSDDLDRNSLFSPTDDCNWQCLPLNSVMSPPRRQYNKNKEDSHSPYFSPSHCQYEKLTWQNEGLLNNEICINLSDFIMLESPLKPQSNTQQKLFSLEDSDTNSQDCVFSSKTKYTEDFSVPADFALRKLDLDSSPPKYQYSMSPYAFSPLERLTNSSNSFSSTPIFGDDDSIFHSRMTNDDCDDHIQPTGLLSLFLTSLNDYSQEDSYSAVHNGSQLSLLPGQSTLLMDNVHNSISGEYSSMLMSPISTKGKKNMILKKRIFDGSSLSPYINNGQKCIKKIFICSSESQVSPRCNSESQVSIINALSNSSTSIEKLTGDLSRPSSLPTIDGGKHPDLSAITHDTLADLIKGKYNHCINSFKILDCRYPYEFEGGQIIGAESWSSPQMVLNHLSQQHGTPYIPNKNEKRDILIFHCEFSANRGPMTYRLMREIDRASSTNYPALHYPEIYLLEGGYKDFYHQYPILCTPEGYTMMLDPQHSEDLKHFRTKSKSWAVENKRSSGRGPMRTGLRRSVL